MHPFFCRSVLAADCATRHLLHKLPPVFTTTVAQLPSTVAASVEKGKVAADIACDDNSDDEDDDLAAKLMEAVAKKEALKEQESLRADMASKLMSL